VYIKRKSKKREEEHEPLPQLYITFSRKKMVERMRKDEGKRVRKRERSWRMKRKAACRGQIKEELAKKEKRREGGEMEGNTRSAALTLESLKTRSSF